MDVRTQLRKGHHRWANATNVLAIEHFRVRDDRDRKTPGYTHIAVVVTASGHAFVGVHRTNRDKQYNRKTSYRACVGKALAAAGRWTLGVARYNPQDGCYYQVDPDFLLDNENGGREMYEEAKKMLLEQGRLRA